jgi:type IV pilus assembly protein PilA
MNTLQGPSRGSALGAIVLLLVLIGTIAALFVVISRKVIAIHHDTIVRSNARQLSAAADEYFKESGATTVAYSSLVGATNYIKAVTPISGETYPSYYTKGVTLTITGVAGTRTLTYAP